MGLFEGAKKILVATDYLDVGNDRGNSCVFSRVGDRTFYLYVILKF